MNIREFIDWMAYQTIEKQQEAAGLLVEAYCQGRLNEVDHGNAEKVIILLLQRADVPVRRSIAECVSQSHNVAPDIITSLVDDIDEVVDPVIVMSPLLSDDELLMLFQKRSEQVQSAIAIRPNLSNALCENLATHGNARVCRALLRNVSSRITVDVLRKIMMRFNFDEAIRSALLQRDNLPIDMRQQIVLRLDMDDVLDLSDLEKKSLQLDISRSDKEIMTLHLCLETDPEDLGDFVLHLRKTGQLTSSFILRTACMGQALLLYHIGSELSNMTYSRTKNVLVDGSARRNIALWQKAGFSEAAACAMEFILQQLREVPDGADVVNPLEFCHELTGKAINLCMAEDIANMENVVLLLQRIRLDIMRDITNEYYKNETTAA